MPFCPKCRDEFQDDVDICPDCKLGLIPRLPSEVSEESIRLDKEPLFLVATAPNEAVGGFWKGILEDNGIKCFLKSDNARAAQYTLLLNQWQQLWVLKSDLRKARALIKPLAQKLRGYPSYGEENIPLASRSAFGLIIVLAMSVGEGLGIFASTAILQHLMQKPRIKESEVSPL